jgi:hypothetical protein
MSTNDPIMAHPPGTEISAPGLGYHCPFECHPHAGDASLVNGTPSVPLVLGECCGRDLVIDITDLSVMDALEYAVQVAHSRLAMFLPRHDVHPFGEPEVAA